MAAMFASNFDLSASPDEILSKIAGNPKKEKMFERLVSELGFWNPGFNQESKKRRAYKHYQDSLLGRRRHIAFDDFGEPETYTLIDYLLSYTPNKGGRRRKHSRGHKGHRGHRGNKSRKHCRGH